MKKLQATLNQKKAMQFRTDAVDYRVLVAGLESSGKSAIIGMIVDKEALRDSLPTYGVNMVPLLHGGNKFIFHEIGGNISSRGFMKYYYSCDAVIYVIDSSKHNKLTKHKYIDTLDMKIDTNNTTNNNNNNKIENKIERILPLPISNNKSNNSSSDNDSDSFLEDPSSPIYTFPSQDDTKENDFKFKSKIQLRKTQSVQLSNLSTINGNISNQIRASIGAKVLATDHVNYEIKTFSATLKTGMKNILQPLTMNETKCNSNEELISKINYDLKCNDIPFLIYFNKQDCDGSLNKNEIIKRLKFDNIINKTRMYDTICCNAFNKTQVFNGFNWLLCVLKEIKNKKKQNAKIMSQVNGIHNIDLSKYGPNVKNPKCIICQQNCKFHGAYCSVCGKWYCQRDAMTKMLKRKSGHYKCKECVGSKSRFVNGQITTTKLKRSKSQI
eukprot:365156_1